MEFFKLINAKKIAKKPKMTKLISLPTLVRDLINNSYSTLLSPHNIVYSHTMLKTPVLILITEVKQHWAVLVLGWVTAHYSLCLLLRFRLSKQLTQSVPLFFKCQNGT